MENCCQKRPYRRLFEVKKGLGGSISVEMKTAKVSSKGIADAQGLLDHHAVSEILAVQGRAAIVQGRGDDHDGMAPMFTLSCSAHGLIMRTQIVVC